MRYSALPSAPWLGCPSAPTSDQAGGCYQPSEPNIRPAAAQTVKMPYGMELPSTVDDLTAFVFLMVAGAFLVGLYGERWRARRARRRWQERRGKGKDREVVPITGLSASAITDPSEQLRIVMESSFEKRRILSRSEARVFYRVEEAIASANLNWRVMAQVSLGEVLSSRDPRAYSTINSKRVDLLIISSWGEPLAAIEYQGGGHYRRTAPARDAVKKEALRKAGVRYIEVTPEHSADDLAREISRLAEAHKLKPLPEIPER